jgi:hypothetical protein
MLGGIMKLAQSLAIFAAMLAIFQTAQARIIKITQRTAGDRA